MLKSHFICFDWLVHTSLSLKATPKFWPPCKSDKCEFPSSKL